MGYTKIRCFLSVEAKFQSAELVSITQAIMTKVSQLFHYHAMLSFSRFTIMQCSQSAVSKSCNAPSQLFQNHAMLPVSCFKIMHPSRLFQNHAMLPVSCFTIMQCWQSPVLQLCNALSQLFQTHAVLPVSCFKITQCSQSAVSKLRSAPSQLFQNYAVLPVSCFKIMQCSFLWGKVSIKAGDKSCSKPAWPSGNAQRQKGSNERLFDTDTQYAHFRGNPLCQATKRHLNNR